MGGLRIFLRISLLFFIGLFFIGIKSIYAMNNEKIAIEDLLSDLQSSSNQDWGRYVVSVKQDKNYVERGYGKNTRRNHRQPQLKCGYCGGAHNTYTPWCGNCRQHHNDTPWCGNCRQHHNALPWCGNCKAHHNDAPWCTTCKAHHTTTEHQKIKEERNIWKLLNELSLNTNNSRQETGLNHTKLSNIGLSFVSSSPPSLENSNENIEIVTHNLNTSIRYQIGNLDYDFETSPQRPSKPRLQSVRAKQSKQPIEMKYENVLKKEKYESILKKIILNKDGREKIDNTTDWPHSFNCQLDMYVDNTGQSLPYGGSGIVVGPHHLLTAGHNVYNKAKYNKQYNWWAHHIKIYPALNGKNPPPFGEAEVTKVYTFKKWVEEESSEFDMALVVLDRSIGLQTGWCGLLSNLNDEQICKETIHITGYPGDKDFNQMWTMAHKVQHSLPDQLFYHIDTFGGQSGSGIIIYVFGEPYAIGVHTIGDKNYNSGTRLTKSKFKNLIVKGISETFKLQN